jgi:F-type H+-transporting ATPase subunit epsilon
MANATTFGCTIITPEAAMLDCNATFVAFPAHDGEMGVMTGRAPLVCKLGIGQLRVETDTEKHLLFVDGGFAQISGRNLSILTEQAKDSRNIDAGAASTALVEARAMPNNSDAEFEAKSKAVERAQIQIKLSKAH